MHKILVIEDEESIRFNIIKCLQFENFQALVAENGNIGVQLAKEQRPNLILCNVMIPEMDGYDVQKLLCQAPATATIPFIFVTAKADKADVRLGKNLGADDYLTKPFTRDETKCSLCPTRQTGNFCLSGDQFSVGFLTSGFYPEH